MNCHSSKLQKFIDLGNQPNGNIFPTIDELDKEQTFPFVMLVCEECWQVQLEKYPSVDSMFSNHPYVTGLNRPVVAHFNEMVQDILHKYPIPENSLVLDIGANDGTLLTAFRKRGMRVLGIDPCNRTGKLAKKANITVAKSFWNKASAESIKQLGLYPDLITATAVFYHTDDIHSFIQGLELVMKEDTIFCTQCVYLKDVIEKGQFDHFYHEHTMIHAIKPLKNLFASYGLRLLDVDLYPIHGGSFVLYVGRNESKYQTSKKITDIIAQEVAVRLNNLQTYLDFTKRVENNKQSLLNMLNQFKADGKRVFGLGAPLKGSTLLNYFGIGPNLVECVTEVNPFKIGHYTPGTHIPIIDERTVVNHPDYYLILSWNFLDFFMEKYADYLKAGGKFIVPHPTIRIIGAESLNQDLGKMPSSKNICV